MHGHKVQFLGDFQRIESRRQAGTVQTPVDKSYRDQMPLVMLTHSIDHLINPLFCGLRASSPVGGFGDKLHEVFSGKGRTQPVRACFITTDHRFIHQVVTEDG